MSLFRKRGEIFSSPISGGLFNDGPNAIEKVEMLFTDVEEKGKKQGYARAAHEYEKVYRELENEFWQIKSIIEREKSSYGNEADSLINKLESLEREKANLEKQVNEKVREVSYRFGISTANIGKALPSGMLISGNLLFPINMLNLVYRHKDKKLREAEQRGYAEARVTNENKINKLKDELKILKEKGNSDIQELISMINEIFAAIADEQMKIAELKILL